MDVPDDLRYTDEHEWLRDEGEMATVGISAYAADQLGDVVFVELPAVGRTLKAVSDLYSPVGGEVTAVNDELASRPELVNADPYASGWMLKLRLTDRKDLDELRDAESYRALIAG